jgi:alpha-N-arabinofuranosidase
MFRHSDVFKLATFTFATAMMSESRTDAILNPTGLLFKMYRDHFGVIPVEVGGNSPQPKPAFPAGGDQPAINPGSPTFPLDVSAALSEDRKTLTFAVINPSETEQTMHLSLNAASLASHGELWQMAAPLLATDTVGQKPEVAVTQRTVDALPGSIVVPPSSVTIYAYPLQ